MTHLRHDVTLTAPPREWADAVLDAVVAEIEAAHFDDELRLACLLYTSDAADEL